MPIHSGQLTVGATPVQVDGNSTTWSHLHIKNMDTTKDLFIGNSNLSSSNGLPIAKLESFEFDLPPCESVSLLASSGTIQVAWVRIDH